MPVQEETESGGVKAGDQCQFKRKPESGGVKAGDQCQFKRKPSLAE